MKRITDKMEWLLELGGTKRDIVFLVISGVALLASMLQQHTVCKLPTVIHLGL